MERTRLRIVRWCSIVLLCGMLASSGWAGAAADEGQVRVRVLIAVPDTAGLDVVLGNGKLLDDAPYRTLSGYQPLAQGSYDLQIFPQDKNDRASALVTRTLTFAAPKDYTLVVYGTQRDREIAVATETDGNQPSRDGRARVRFTNAQRGSGTITLATSGGVQIGRAAYGASAEYVALDPGTATLEVRDNGQVTASADVTFAPGTVVSIFLLGPGTDAAGSALLINADATGAGATGGTAGARGAGATQTPATRATATPPPGYTFVYATNTPGPGGGQTGGNTGVFPTSTPIGGVRPTLPLGTAAPQPNYTPSAALRRAALPVPPCPRTAGCAWFTETNHAVANGFKTFWDANGGKQRWGLPITEEFKDTSLIDGKLRTVQYFERTRLEYFPENRGKAGEVQETSLGREVLRLLGVAG